MAVPASDFCVFYTGDKFPGFFIEQADIYKRLAIVIISVASFLMFVIIKGQFAAPFFNKTCHWSPGGFQVVADLLGCYPKAFTVDIWHAIVVLQRTDRAPNKSGLAIGPAEAHGAAAARGIAVIYFTGIIAVRNISIAAALVISGIAAETIKVQIPVASACIQ